MDILNSLLKADAGEKFTNDSACVYELISNVICLKKVFKWKFNPAWTLPTVHLPQNDEIN